MGSKIKMTAFSVAVILLFFVMGENSAVYSAEIDDRGQITLTEEETNYLVESVALAAGGVMRIEGRNHIKTAAPYAARVGIAATVLNRLKDPRFPDSIALIIASDRTFSPASAVNVDERDLDITLAALEAALSGFDPTNGALYFSTPTEQSNQFIVTCEFGGYSFGVPE